MARPITALFNQNQNPIPSSSPAFGTPVHPIRPRNDAPLPPIQLKPTILPVNLPPAILRPHAFRTLTNKYNLNFRPSALAALAQFIGKHCGSGWREEGLAEGVLEEVAKSWKKQYGDAIVDGDGDRLKYILKSVESCMVGGKLIQGKSALSRQSSFATGEGNGTALQNEGPGRPSLNTETSFGMSELQVADGDDEDASKDPRDWITLVNSFLQPRLAYNPTKKHFEKYDHR
jgi:DNA polymerase epsilon subunit 2